MKRILNSICAVFLVLTVPSCKKSGSNSTLNRDRMMVVSGNFENDEFSLFYQLRTDGVSTENTSINDVRCPAVLMPSSEFPANGVILSITEDAILVTVDGREWVKNDHLRGGVYLVGIRSKRVIKIESDWPSEIIKSDDLQKKYVEAIAQKHRTKIGEL